MTIHIKAVEQYVTVVLFVVWKIISFRLGTVRSVRVNLKCTMLDRRPAFRARAHRQSEEMKCNLVSI